MCREANVKFIENFMRPKHTFRCYDTRWDSFVPNDVNVFDMHRPIAQNCSVVAELTVPRQKLKRMQNITR